MKIINFISWFLAFLGAINLLLAAFNIDLVREFFSGSGANFIKIVKFLMGISVLYQLTRNS